MEVDKIMNRFNWLISGIRVIMLTLRPKDGGIGGRPDRVAYKIISRNEEEFKEKLNHVLEKWTDGQRIYVNVNNRDMAKAIRSFKQAQLNNDYQDEDSKNWFYIDIWNRWVSALMQPSSKSESWFLIDIDNDDKYGITKEFVVKRLQENNILIIDTYQTKNGWHVITAPFNYPKLIPELHKWDHIKTDGMALIKF